MLKELRSCGYSYLLAFHILLLIAKGKTPSAITDFPLCSRSSIYRAIEAWREGKLQEQWWPTAPERETQRTASLTPLSLMLLWVIKQPQRVFGWCRTRWSCAVLVLRMSTRTGATYLREPIRRQLLAADYVWQRAKLKGRDDDPERARTVDPIPQGDL
jgi:hypothetical protein